MLGVSVQTHVAPGGARSLGTQLPLPLETVPACPARVLHAELALATLAPTRRAPDQLGSALGTTSKCPERASCVAANDGSSAPANCKGFN